MGKLADFRAERATIATQYNESKRSIHENYMMDLANLEKTTRLAYQALVQRRRAFWNKAAEAVKEEL